MRVSLNTTILLAACLALCGCAQPQSARSATVKPQPGMAAGNTRLIAALAEVQSAQPPAELNPELFELLRNRLVEVLEERISSGTGRSASFTPRSAGSQVIDLVATSAGAVRLSFTYRNSGDYDRNGEVNIADLTEVGLHFQRAPSHPLWLIAQRADGDGNGEVNVADVTPIGLNFGSAITGYEVWAATSLTSDWSLVGDIKINNMRRNQDRPRFVELVDAPGYEYFSLWTYDDSEYDGGWSNNAELDKPVGRKLEGMFNYFN